MSANPLKTLSDRLTDAHTRIQQDHKHLNPVVGVNRQMRKSGIPADAITIDCLVSNKRILLVLHDQQLETVHYQFGVRDQDPSSEFSSMPFQGVTETQLYNWMVTYF